MKEQRDALREKLAAAEARATQIMGECDSHRAVARQQVDAAEARAETAEKERDEARAMSGNLCDAAAQWRTYATEYHEGLFQANAWAARWKAAAKHFRKDAEHGWGMQFAAEVLAARAEEERDAAVARAGSLAWALEKTLSALGQILPDAQKQPLLLELRNDAILDGWVTLEEGNERKKNGR